jgi:predicted PurR-regulated permease PerM
MNNLKKTCLLISVIFIFAVYLLACSTSVQNSNNLTANQNTRISNANTNQFDVAEFERNRELWTSKNIQNYKMIVGASGFLTNFQNKF